MRRILLLVFSLLLSVPFYAQTDDPVVMDVNGYEVKKSEFEYFFKKNNIEKVVNKKTIKEYADLYLNFKLKVQAALTAGVDQTDEFKQEFSMYRDAQAEKYLVDEDFLEEQAHSMYQTVYDELGAGGLVYLLEMTSIPEDETPQALEESVTLMDSAYAKLLAGGDFRELAAEYSNDEFAMYGGEMGWISREGMPEILSDVIDNLRIGSFSEPFIMDGVVYIIQLEGTRTIGTYENERDGIFQWMANSTDLFTEARYRAANAYAKRLGWDVRDEEACFLADSLLEEIEPEFANLSREYHDGLLMFDVSSKEIWEKTNNDPEGMKKWFESNKKKLKFDGPRYKGMVFFCVDEKAFRDLEVILDGVDVNDWVDSIVVYNRESIKARVMKGPQGNGVFKEGDNAYIDNMVFGTGAKYEAVKNFPYVNVMGKMIDRPETMYDVRNQVSEGYQTYLEKQWVKKLRKQYKYKIYRKALKQVSIAND